MIRRTLTVFGALVGLALVTLSASSPGAAPPQYDLVDLGVLGVGAYSQAFAINDRSQVVGISETGPGEAHAFLWDRGVMIDLGTLAGSSYSAAVGINNNGVVVGYSMLPDGSTAAFRWKDGVMTRLSDLSGASGINDDGDIIGAAPDGQGSASAAIWRNGQVTLLKGLGDQSSGIGISNSGLVLAYAFRSAGDGSFMTVLLGPRRMTDLPEFWEAFSLNSSGVVVGTANGSSLIGPLVWSNGVATILQDPPGAIGYDARAINDSGVIAGNATGPWGNGIPVTWHQGVPTVLPVPEGASGAAWTINGRGDVGGIVAYPEGHAHAALWISRASK